MTVIEEMRRPAIFMVMVDGKERETWERRLMGL